eukprot:2395121-Amphidinium_carterae.1
MLLANTAISHKSPIVGWYCSNGRLPSQVCRGFVALLRICRAVADLSRICRAVEMSRAAYDGLD